MFNLTFRLLCLLTLLCSLFLAASAQRRSTNQVPISIERVATSFMDRSVDVEFTFSQSPANYAANSVFNYNVNGSSQTPVTTSPSTKPNVLVFKIPNDNLKDSSQVEFQVLINDAQNNPITKSPWSQLDLSFMKTIESQVKKIGELQGEKTTWATQETSYKGQVAQLTSANEVLTGKYQATQFDINGIKPFSTDKMVVIAVKLNLIGDVTADFTCLDCGSTNYDKVVSNNTNQISTRNGDISILKFEGLPANRHFRAKIFILDVKSRTPYNQSTPYTIEVPTANNQIDSLSITGTDDAKLRQIDNKDEKLTVQFDASDEGFVYFTYAEKIGTSTAQGKNFGEFTVDQYGQPTGKIPVKRGENKITIEGPASGKTYNILVNGMNKFGNQTSGIANKEFTVPKNKTLDFDRSQPITANISPLGMTLSWKANMKPERAEFLIEYVNPLDTTKKLTISAPTASIEDDFKISLTMPTNSAFSVGSANVTNNKQNRTVENPTIIARMITDNGRTVVEQRIQMIYKIPTQQEIQQQVPGNDPTSKALRNDLTEAIEAFNSNGSKSIPWGKFLKAGFSFLIKAAL